MMEVRPWNGAREAAQFRIARDRWGSCTAYEQSLLYLNQALRRGGWVFESSLGWVALAQDYVGRDGHAFVAPMGSDVTHLISKACEAARSRGLVPALVKHVEEPAASELVKRGLARRCNDSASQPGDLEDYSEDTLPQILLDIGPDRWRPEDERFARYLPVTLDGPHASDFRYQLRRFCNARPGVDSTVEQVDIKRAAQQVVTRAIDNWLSSLALRFHDSKRPHVRDFNACFRTPVETAVASARNGESDGFGSVLVADGRPCGIWIGAPIRQPGYGIYVLIADTRVKNLAHYTLYSALLDMRRRGALTVNIGGSELGSLFYFKSKAARKSDGEWQRRVFDLCFE